MANKLRWRWAISVPPARAVLVLTRTAISVSEQPLMLSQNVPGLPSWKSITMQPLAVPIPSISDPAFARCCNAWQRMAQRPSSWSRPIGSLATSLCSLLAMTCSGVSAFAIIPASAPDFFTEDTPTAVLVRQVLGAIAQFEKASIVAKLAAARKRKREREGRCEGRKPLSETRPEVVALARRLRRRRPNSCRCVTSRKS